MFFYRKSSQHADLYHKPDSLRMRNPVGHHADGTRCWTIGCQRNDQPKIGYDALPTSNLGNDTKICGRCKKDLPISSFGIDRKAKTGLQSYCFECRKKKASEYYYKNKASLDAKAIIRNNANSKRNKEYVLLYKQTHPCIDCGMKKVQTLDFDHRDSTGKRMNIGESVDRITLARLQEEISKCDIRCANCHRIKTYDENTWRTGRMIETGHLTRVARNNAIMKMRKQNIMRDYMRDGCTDCHTKDIRVLELDHVRGEKVAHVAHMLRNGSALQAFTDEVNKCDVRCANCHRLVTYERRNAAFIAE